MNQEPIIESQKSLDVEESTATKLSYSLTARDIFVLILRIHFALLLLPMVFLAGHIILILSEFEKARAYMSFVLFALSLVGVIYIYLMQFFIFKKQYYFGGSHIVYNAEFLDSGIKTWQDESKNLTEYAYSDFIKWRETKKTLYLYFRYDRALIIKKHCFVTGDEKSLRELLKNRIIKKL